MADTVKKFNPKERDELYNLALKLENGAELTPAEKVRWSKLFPRFEALKAAAEARLAQEAADAGS